MLPPHPTKRRLQRAHDIETNFTASASAVYASRTASPLPMQDSLPAGWLAFAGREFNPLDQIERFQSLHLIPLSRAYPDASWAHMKRKVSPSFGITKEKGPIAKADRSRASFTRFPSLPAKWGATTFWISRRTDVDRQFPFSVYSLATQAFSLCLPTEIWATGVVRTPSARTHSASGGRHCGSACPLVLVDPSRHRIPDCINLQPGRSALPG
jgi:hypothetical protein